MRNRIMMGSMGADSKKEFIQCLAARNRERYSAPETSGILRVIKLSFDHPRLYLFELVQNALDAKAKTISIQKTESEDSMIFQHDGSERLDQKDVEGLSHLLQSTKGALSVGFMGIGFKSVFGRFQEVRVSGWDWRFKYEVKQTIGSRFGDEQTDLLGAVVPIWESEIQQPDHNFTTRFELRNPRGAPGVLDQDLDWFFSDRDPSLLAILAEAGLERFAVNEQVWDLSVTEGSFGTSVARASKGHKSRLWQLFSVQYRPSDEAIKCFLEHREIQPSKEEEDRVYEDAARPRRVLGILPLDGNGVPATERRGRVYATLPTEVTLPFSFHVNADWLLNISRTGLKEIEENQWQREIVDRIADVLALFIVWAANAYSDPEAAKASFRTLSPPTSEAGAIDNLLVEERWLDKLKKLLENQAVLPVWTEEQVPLAYAKPGNSILPPRQLAKAFKENPDLNPSILLGGKVINQEILGNKAQKFFVHAKLITEMTPPELESTWPKGVKQWWQFNSGNKEERQRMLLRIWAAVADLLQNEKWRNIQLNCIRTVCGNWLSVDQVFQFTEELPSKKEPGGEKVQQFLKPYADSNKRIPKNLIHALNRLVENESYKEFTYARTKKWLDNCAQIIMLKDVVEIALDHLASSENPNWSILVPLGQWAKNRSRNDLMKYVLVDTHKQSHGVPVGEALVAAPYVQDGRVRRRIYSENPPVSKKYLDSDKHSGNFESWRDFFYRAGVKGKLKIECLKECSSRYGKGHVAKLIGRNESEIDDSNDDGYTLLDYDITPGLPNPDSPLEVRSAIASWLDEGWSELQDKGRRSAEFFYHRRKKCQGTRVCTWVEKLMTIEWVPCSDEMLRKPENVLAVEDPARAHSPFARLSRDLVEALEKEGIKFGSAVPEAIALHKLRTRGDKANDAELVQMLQECHVQIKSEADQEEFARVLESITVPLGGGRRVPLCRIAKSENRNLLDGWIIGLSELALPLQSELLKTKFLFPDATSGRQALAFLRDAWRRAKASPDRQKKQEIDALPFAYEYCLEDCNDNAELLSHWQDALPEAALVADGKWIGYAEFDELFVDDLADRRHVPAGICPRTVSEEQLGTTGKGRRRTIDEFKLKSLKESVVLSWTDGESMSIPESWPSRIDLVCRLLRCSDSTGGHVGDRGAEVANSSRLRLVLVRELELTVSISGSEPEYVPVDARRCGNELVVAGRPTRFASDAAKELMQLFSFDRRGSLATDLTGLLSAIDDAAEFRRAVDKFRRSHARDFQIPGEYQQCFAEGVGPAQERARTAKDQAKALDGVRGQSPDLHDSAANGKGLGSGSSMGARGPHAGSGSYTWERAAASKRSLAEKQRRGLLGEIQPNADSWHDRASAEPSEDLGDERFREAAEQYEKERGWIPVLGHPQQSGWDIKSSDPNTGAVRLIEVKGRGTAWTDDEVVELSRAQVRKAFQTASENAVTWYLYVVERNHDGSYRVLPIKNPVMLAGFWMLRGGSWRELAEDQKRIFYSHNTKS